MKIDGSKMNPAFKVELAFIILVQERKDKGIDVPGEVVIKAYANGREQGFHYTFCPDGYVLGTLGVSFSEYRNSDQIVVYYGNDCDFSMDGNIPSQSIYDSRRYFAEDDYAKAAAFIYDFFASGWRKLVFNLV